MPRAFTSRVAAAALLSTGLAACATAPAPVDAEQQALADLEAAMEEAMKPASPEEVAAANRSDPLTRANFWAKEHQKDAENLDTALQFGSALRAIGSHERVIEVTSKVLIVHPESTDLLMLLGRSMISMGNFNGGASAFYKVAGLDPTRADAYAALGTALDRLDRHEDAQASYKQALVLQPGRTSTLTNLGLSYALSGNLTAAEQSLREAAAQPNADTRVTENLALVLGLQGKIDEFESVSGKTAPKSIVEDNAEMLREMISPGRTWESLTQSADNTATTQPEMPRNEVAASASQPSAQEEVPTASTTTPVEEDDMSLIGEQKTSATGLRLRR
ncbi:MAG: hypothetical protein ACRBEQ_06125 [Hyphomonas sp.]